MLKRGIMVLALVATVALPFILRPRQESASEADDTLVLVSPHNEAIRHEFTLGFSDWYKARTGRTVFLDWRNVGGTSDITRFLEGEYVASFRSLWTGKLGRPWSMEVQSGFQDGRLEAAAPAAAREARSAFLASDAGCGIDLFFGGGSSDFESQAQAGRLVDSGVRRLHPDWFTDAAFPLKFGGETYRDPDDLWYGSVLSSYGIIYNRDALARLGFEHGPEQWADLANPRYVGEVGLCDPTQSGSIAQAFINVIQQQIHGEVDAACRRGRFRSLGTRSDEGRGPRRLDRRHEAPAAPGRQRALFYRHVAEAADRRGGRQLRRRHVHRLLRQGAAGGRPAPHDRPRQAGLRLPGGRRGVFGGPDRRPARRAAPRGGARLHGVRSLPRRPEALTFKPGRSAVPRNSALRRLPVRRDFYSHADWTQYRDDADVDPYSQKKLLVYVDAWTADVYTQMRFIIRVMTEDTHPELVSAWRAIIAAPEPARSKALAVLQDVSSVDYDRALGPIKKALGSKNLVDTDNMSRELGDTFRATTAGPNRSPTERNKHRNRQIPSGLLVIDSL